MYDDLRKHEPQIHAHTLLRAIGGDNVAIPQPGRLIDAGEIDTQVSPGHILEILEADSSQQEAILAAKAGANFVLQGPPGTGKSQTIANVIAECLGQGEKVLFVSEKMAALEVVWKRLREAGLDEFLLNLHDPRQKRDGFLRNLAAALRNTDDAAEPIRAWETNSLRLQQERDELNTYVRELHAPRFELRISAFDAYAELAKRQDAPRFDFQVTDARSIGERQLASMRRLLDDLSEHLDILDQYNEHPWRDTLLTRHEITKESDIQAHFTRLNDALRVIASDGARLRLCVEPHATPKPDSQPSDAPTLEQARRNSDVAELALAAPFPPLRPWLNEAHATELLGVAAHAQERSDTYHTETAEIAQIYQRSLYDTDLEAVYAGLTTACERATSSLAHDARQSPHDVAITDRQRIATVLDESALALAALLDAARAVAAELDLPSPATPQDAFQLNGLATHVLATPRPPRTWLRADDFTRVAVLATDAGEHARSARTLREAVAAVYRDDLFALDVVTLEERFRAQYRSIFRRLGGQYRADARTVRSYIRPEAQATKRSFAEMASDLGMAKRVFADEGWLRERRADLAGALGRLYDVGNPDWQRILATITWTQAFHQGFARIAPQTEPTETLVQLVISGGLALESLRAHAASLAVALDRWAACARPLQTTVNISKLTPPPGDVYTAPMEPLLAGVRTTVEGLRALWSAVDTLDAHHLSAHPAGSSRWSDLVHQVEVARHVVAAERWLREQAASYRDWFGDSFADFTTDWNRLLEGLRWSQSLADTYESGEVPAALAERITEDADPGAWDELERLTDSVAIALAALDEELAYVETVLPHTALHDAERTVTTTPVDALMARVSALLTTLPDLERLLASRRHIEE
ncbi:MAG TPA: AAA domain-containing protein, partial [Ktedonobacterales bacterium]|nr:AAA domain-containing protein [Ktedonobacterales bacterium]